MMTQTLKVLIVSASIGEGHNQAARALQEELKKRYASVQVDIVDFMAGEHSYLNTFLKETYLKMISFSPEIYDILYRWSQAPKRGLKVQDFMVKVMRRAMLRLLERYRPDVMICTHPFPCGTAAALKREGSMRAPLAGVITDFAVHNLWVHPNVDFYFVAAEKLRAELIGHGIVPERIHATGIPIMSKFREGTVLKEKLHKGRMKAPRILVMGGGLGLGSVEETLQSLNRISMRLELIFVTGHNSQLRASVEKAAKTSRHTVCALGFTDRIHELMATADLLITKPGALTISEALAMSLPMVFVQPIPGQEEDNAAFIAQQGAGLWIKRNRSLNREIVKLLSNPAYLGAMKENARRIGHPAASADAVRLIASHLFRRLDNLSGTQERKAGSAW